MVEGVIIYPQRTVNVSVGDKKAAVNDPYVKKACAEGEKIIDGRGRVLLRESGTEPCVRVMVESESEALCAEICEKITSAIKERGYL